MLKDNEFLLKFKNTPKLRDLCKTMRLASYKPDEVIITEGEIGDKFYILLKGEVSISKGQRAQALKGKIVQVSHYSIFKLRNFHQRFLQFQKHLCDLNPGDSFGELALTQDVPRSVTATAKIECKIITLDQESYLTVIKNLRNYQVDGIADFLYHLPLFHYIERPLLVELAKRVEFKKFSTNTLILRQED